MITVGYCSPFIPPEWIAAHGLQPQWVPLGGVARAGVARGVCPYAEGLLEAGAAAGGAALVAATTCDQIRHAVAVLESRGTPGPFFLFNMPATWQGPAARRYYQDELLRLGRFLVGLGGKPPSASDLAGIMLDYDRARCALRGDATAHNGPARHWAEAMLAYRSGKQAEIPPTQSGGFRNEQSQSPPIASLRVENEASKSPPTASGGSAAASVPLALVGGPLPPQDFWLLELVEQCGGRIVLDASETGERTLPPPLRPQSVRDRPLEELADAYFLGIPDVVRRPNDRLYQWLAERITSRGVRGLLLRRYVWCDLWHAEWRRLAAWSPVPVLELDVADDEPVPSPRARQRIEAFLETLGGAPP
jgi:benzoyl-CoA reductase/2-hydroxyglutaryl-CoA dehydratase subunit BcrC/BadD/HgdB